MYHAGKKSHKTNNDDMIDEIVSEVERKAAEVRAEREGASEAAE